MKQGRIIPTILALAFAAVAFPPLHAQTGQQASATHLRFTPVPERTPPMPFPPDGRTAGRVYSTEFRSADQMSEKDRLAEADAESSIRERAESMGLELNEGRWNYRQLVCPALPNHLFLQFTRDNGTGDVSVFSASIPLNGEGRVRIIPIQLRSYSLFSPAPINAITISAFNHIRAEDHPNRVPDWLTTGLCYAALAGAHPKTASFPENPGNQKVPDLLRALMEIPSKGGAIIRFSDVANPSRPMEWTMTFNGDGKLLKATHTPASLDTERVVPQTAQERDKVRVVPETIVDQNPKQTP